MSQDLKKTFLKKNTQGQQIQRQIPWGAHFILFPIFLIPYPLKQGLS